MFQSQQIIEQLNKSWTESMWVETWCQDPML